MLPGDLIRYKQNGRQITVLTAWDSLSSSIVEAAGADLVLVGDSLAMVVLGHETTLPVTLDQMLHHAQAVERGFCKPKDKQPLLICDLPFLSYQCGEDKAVEAAGKILKNSSTAGVKLEGAEPEIISVIERLIRMGLPVMGHLGLTPQSIYSLGLKRQAEDESTQRKVISQALRLEQAGCFSLIIEHVPETLAGELQSRLKIPVIGIGAGEQCDGQVRVTADLLGLTPKQPPFSKPLISGREIFIQALQDWVSNQNYKATNPTKAASESKLDY
tara:strand:+ start:329 stop:1147 length:819 start_codon:yes stop_codon:yes gene_type:complete